MFDRGNKPARARGKAGQALGRGSVVRDVPGLRGPGGTDVKTSAIFLPFDLFGSGGTRAGSELLADAVREMLADNKREKVPTRARAYAGKIRVTEFTFDRLDD